MTEFGDHDCPECTENYRDLDDLVVHRINENGTAFSTQLEEIMQENDGGETSSFQEVLNQFARSLDYPAQVEWYEDYESQGNSKWGVEVNIPVENWMEDWDNYSQKLTEYLEDKGLKNRRNEVFVRATPIGESSPTLEDCRTMQKESGQEEKANFDSGGEPPKIPSFYLGNSVDDENG